MPSYLPVTERFGGLELAEARACYGSVFLHAHCKRETPKPLVMTGERRDRHVESGLSVAGR